MNTKKNKKNNNQTRKNNNHNTKFNYEFNNILDVDKDTLKELDEHQTQCWKDKDKVSRFHANWVRRDKRKFYVIYLRNDKKKIIFSEIFSTQTIKINNKEQKFLYLRSACTSQEERNKGIFKNSLVFIKKYFKNKGFYAIRLNIDTEKINDIDPLTRTIIFHKSGFVLDPTTIHYKDNSKIYNTIIKLKNNNFVKLLKFNKNSKYNYKIQTEKNEIKNIDIEDIDYCTISKEKYYCPMIMQM